MWGAAVAQRKSGENEKINEIERTRVRSPSRATSLKKRRIMYRILAIFGLWPLHSRSLCFVQLCN
jgi:hypothetical protein